MAIASFYNPGGRTGSLLRGSLFVFAACLQSCSLSLDFNSVTGLPCPCDEDHVCVNGTSCRLRGSVELYKSCNLGADQPDDLCPSSSACESVNGEGLRCLPTCRPTNYGVAEAGLQIAQDCATGFTCWPTDRGGVCSEGICRPLENDCGTNQRCVVFNGAGVCFPECVLFSNRACGLGQICQPVGESSVTACIDAGTRALGELCDGNAMCQANDTLGRALICDRAINSRDLPTCRAVCACTNGDCSAGNATCGVGANCVLSRANYDAVRGLSLGICI